LQAKGAVSSQEHQQMVELLIPSIMS